MSFVHGGYIFWGIAVMEPGMAVIKLRIRLLLKDPNIWGTNLGTNFEVDNDVILMDELLLEGKAFSMQSSQCLAG